MHGYTFVPVIQRGIKTQQYLEEQGNYILKIVRVDSVHIYFTFMSIHRYNVRSVGVSKQIDDGAVVNSIKNEIHTLA